MGVDFSDSHPAMDKAEHQTTYDGFVMGVKVSCILSVLLLIGMAVFLL